ncbi:MAG: histidine kinase [Candidatus Magnetoglobus multicellularis str. Araruama]|uniref:histidine kinase n=1 Tax=Candidatus Magnetoglobus multicellularis str. Araruama TaxID=890399 RepID=A0A1V1P7D7_9BACT|nr:MAG: histidine kinase [Candidatus Magnetoglobus multicellularis str. Araruama]
MTFKNYKYIILLVDPFNEFNNLVYNFFQTTTSCNAMTCDSQNNAFQILESTPVNMILFHAENEVQGISFFEQIQAYPELQKVMLIDKVLDKKLFFSWMNDGLFNKFLTKPFQDIHLLLMAFESINEHLKNTLDERIKMEEQFVHNEKMSTLGQMMAGIAHELKNPTTFIHSNLNNLKKFVPNLFQLIDRYEQLDLPSEIASEIDQFKEDINYAYLKERVPRMIERTAEGTDRLKKILLDLKLFYRKDAQSFEMADINAAIESSLNIISHEYKDRITINKEFGYLPEVECNITKINQVFVNLLINACHAISDIGEVTICTCEMDDRVQIDISDTGCGMPESVQKQIFQPFYTTKPGTLGSGLGLSISNKVIKAHKGRITVKSQVDKGTTFTIVLPIKQSDIN